MKRYLKYIAAGAIILSVLAAAFFCGGSKHGSSPLATNQPERQTEQPSPASQSPTHEASATQAPPSSAAPKVSIQKENATAAPEQNVLKSPSPAPTKPAAEGESAKSGEYSCTLTVSCAAILNNPAALKPEKAALVPPDGIIYKEQTAVFHEGESVFNVLQREMKKNKIHFEYIITPIYGSAYIEGINNLYEFDCGELSGWMYTVNGEFPSCGCSRYRLADKDKIELIYTCDFGKDIGGYNDLSEEVSGKNAG